MSALSNDYSNISRNLTNADIGQKVLRVSPYRQKDRSNCFYKGAKPETLALKFEGIANNYLQFSYDNSGQPTKRFISTNWNDGKWVTVDELIRKLQEV